jgi:hypothetical protein
MSKKLLITLGCSWTYGIGVPTAGPWGQGAWPTQLSKMLDCDLINLSIPGASNSGQAKALINGKYDPADFKKWGDVHVIMMLSGDNRFSFYKGKNDIVDMNPTNVNSGWAVESRRSFLKEYATLMTDSGVEQETLFYIKCVENYCQANNFKFNYTSAWEPMPTESTASSLNEKLGWGQNSAAWRIQQEHPDIPDWGMSPCGHPNIDGYSLIAKELARVLA